MVSRRGEWWAGKGQWQIHTCYFSGSGFDLSLFRGPVRETGEGMFCVQLIESIDYVSRAGGANKYNKGQREETKTEHVAETYVLLSCVSAMTASILSEMSTLVAQTSEMDYRNDYLRRWPTISEVVRRLWRCGLSRGR